MAEQKIGFVGLGSMGGDQARELAKLPNQLTVYDVAPAAMDVFQGKARLAATMADAGRDSDVVGVCVRDDAQVNECAAALVPAMASGSILLIHSTVRPATVTRIAEQAAARGVHVLDAPVTRTEMTKDGPFVFCMTGGDETLAQRVQPVLNAFATNTLHIGPLGSAMALKISNNLISWCEIMIGLEAVDMAEAAGVPGDKLLTVMKRNGVMTPPMKGFIEFRNNPGDQSRRSFMASQAGIGEKDLQLAEALAEGAGTSVPITSHVRAMLRQQILDICAR